MNRVANSRRMLLAHALFALGSPTIKFLVERGSQFGLTHQSAISFCNVLFIGNLCAGILLFLRLGPRQIMKQGRSAKGDLPALLFSIALAALYPALLFTALESTTVTNLVLLSRSEAVLYALSTSFFLGTRYTRREVAGYSMLALGIAFLALLDSDFRVMKGDGLVLTAGIVFAIDVLVSKKLLQKIETGTFTFARTLGSALVFAAIAVNLYGPDHFAEAFQGELWIAMLFYSGLIVVLANLIYYRELPNSTPPYLAKLSLASPAFSIVFAFVLLGEVPDAVQVAAGLIILVGLAVATLGARKTQKMREEVAGPGAPVRVLTWRQ